MEVLEVVVLGFLDIIRYVEMVVVVMVVELC